MPTYYVDMSADEINYCGGFGWIPICAAISGVCTLISTACTAASIMGIKNKTISNVGKCATVLGTATGIASGVGLLWTSTAKSSVKTLATATSSLTAEPGMSVATWYL